MLIAFFDQFAKPKNRFFKLNKFLQTIFAFPLTITESNLKKYLFSVAQGFKKVFRETEKKTLLK